MRGIADHAHHTATRRHPATPILLACALALCTLFTLLALGLTPSVSASPVILTAKTPTRTIARTATATATIAPTLTPTPAIQPTAACTDNWCEWVNVQHWWLLGAPLLLIAGIMLLLAMRAEMRTARAGTRRAKKALQRAAEKAMRRSARRAAWARFFRRKPRPVEGSHLWDDLPDETYTSGPLLPPTAPTPRPPAERRPSYMTVRRSQSHADDQEP